MHGSTKPSMKTPFSPEQSSAGKIETTGMMAESGEALPPPSTDKIDLANTATMRTKPVIDQSEYETKSKSLSMALHFRDRVSMASGGFTTTGLFLPGISKHPDKPLIVLLHGSGVNARYWDNSIYSLPNDFATNGYDVLNIQRSGYGGEKCPATQTPILDTIPLYASLISFVYQHYCVAKNGIILIGSGVGSAISLAIAAEHAGPELPVVGISSCCYLPASKADEEFPLMGVKGLLLSNTGEAVAEDGQKMTLYTAQNPANPLYIAVQGQNMIVDLSPEGIKNTHKFDFVEAATEQELAEEHDPIWEHRLKFDIGPRIKTPIQYLISPYDVLRKPNQDAQAALAEVITWFKNSASVDKGVLLMPTGPLYEVEGRDNRFLLQQRRETFCMLVTRFGLKEIWWDEGLCADLSGKILWKAGEIGNNE